MTWFIIGVVAVVVYVSMIGLLQPVMAKQKAYRCPNCAKGRKSVVDGINYEPGEGHDDEGLQLAMFWPFTAPYMLANSITSDSNKRAKANIESYWADKKQIENRERLERMEKEVGFN